MSAANIDPVDVKLGERLKQVRKTARISQETLAKASGITFQQVQKYEAGTNRISVSRLLEFCKTLGCFPMDIIGGAGGVWKDGPNDLFDRAIDASRKLKQISSIVNEERA